MFTQDILCKIVFTFTHNSWNCHYYNDALIIHENAGFIAIFVHIVILFQSRLISYTMREKHTKFCNFISWQHPDIFINLSILLDIRQSFICNALRNRIFKMQWFKNFKNKFLIFKVCVAYIWGRCKIYTSARSPLCQLQQQNIDLTSAF